MDWTRAVDAYCERVSDAYWAEPVNALTNLAFVLAALFMWRRARGNVLAKLLCLTLGAIGVGSFLFHTFAQVWAGVADVAPIGLFILFYLYAINRYAVGLGPWSAFGATMLFVPYAGMMVPIFSLIPALGSSAGYAPVALLIFLYAGFLRNQEPELAAGMALGALLLCISLAFRTVDEPLCASWPIGTHFVWHLLNAVMLGWMIEVYCRLRLGKHELAR